MPSTYFKTMAALHTGAAMGAAVSEKWWAVLLLAVIAMLYWALSIVETDA